MYNMFAASILARARLDSFAVEGQFDLTLI